MKAIFRRINARIQRYRKKTMNVTIKPDSQRFVEDQMKAGRYTSPEDVVQAGLRLLQEHQANLAQVRAKIAVGLDQARRGELVDGEVVFDEVFGPAESSNTRSQGRSRCNWQVYSRARQP
ncbi:MAG: type II toxin-antitoxin system ParD family antitoxin [Tepidisphaeraceae bacterium]|jgi:antitoxin ParD1/3/4